MQPPVDPSFYEYTQLDDTEIIQREVIRQAWAERDAMAESERQRQMRNFTFKGGML